jgi:hypothetical protein
MMGRVALDRSRDVSQEEGYFQRYHKRKEPSLLPKPVEDTTDLFIDMQNEMERAEAERPRAQPTYEPFSDRGLNCVLAALWPFGLLIAVSVTGVGVGKTDWNFDKAATWFGVVIMLVGLGAMLYLLFPPVRGVFRLVRRLTRRRVTPPAR